MNFTGKIADLTTNAQGKTVLLLLLNERKEWGNLHDCELDIEISKHREHRSISANNYAWLLMGRIAEVTQIQKNEKDDVSPTEEVYHQMLCDYGQNELSADGAITTISTESELKGDWYIHSSPIGKSELKGKTFIHYRMIKGSSKYNTKEMSIFLDGVISECKILGIETKRPEEIKSMMEAWK